MVYTYIYLYINKQNLPESPPYVEAHCIQPEECGEEKEVGHDSCNQKIERKNKYKKEKTRIRNSQTSGADPPGYMYSDSFVYRTPGSSLYLYLL